VPDASDAENLDVDAAGGSDSLFVGRPWKTLTGMRSTDMLASTHSSAAPF